MIIPLLWPRNIGGHQRALVPNPLASWDPWICMMGGRTTALKALWKTMLQNQHTWWRGQRCLEDIQNMLMMLQRFHNHIIVNWHRPTLTQLTLNDTSCLAKELFLFLLRNGIHTNSSGKHGQTWQNCRTSGKTPQIWSVLRLQTPRA